MKKILISLLIGASCIGVLGGCSSPSTPSENIGVEESAKEDWTNIDINVFNLKCYIEEVEGDIFLVGSLKNESNYIINQAYFTYESKEGDKILDETVLAFDSTLLPGEESKEVRGLARENVELASFWVRLEDKEELDKEIYIEYDHKKEIVYMDKVSK